MSSSSSGVPAGGVDRDRRVEGHRHLHDVADGVGLVVAVAPVVAGVGADVDLGDGRCRDARHVVECLCEGRDVVAGEVLEVGRGRGELIAQLDRVLCIHRGAERLFHGPSVDVVPAHRAEVAGADLVFERPSLVACPPDGFVVGEGDERSVDGCGEKRRGDAVHGGIGDCRDCVVGEIGVEVARSDRSVVGLQRVRRDGDPVGVVVAGLNCVPESQVVCSRAARVPGLLRVTADVDSDVGCPAVGVHRHVLVQDDIDAEFCVDPVWSAGRGHDQRCDGCAFAWQHFERQRLACGERVALVVNGERGKCPEVHGDRLVRRGVARYRGGCALEGAGGDGDRCLPLPERPVRHRDGQHHVERGPGGDDGAELPVLDLAQLDGERQRHAVSGR